MHDPSRDYVVLPEDLGPKILRFAGRKVVFNKNLYHGFQQLFGGDVDPYLDDDLVAVFSVSEHNARHLRHAYPRKPIIVLTPDIRLEHFPFKPLRDKSPVIACLPKAPGQIATLYQMLRARARGGIGPTAGFKWRLLKDMTEREVGGVLHDALMLVFLSVEEGLPRMPLEAMAAGCLVVTWAEGPLRDYLPDGWGFEHGDLLGMVSFIERVAEQYPSGLDEFDPVVHACRRTVEGFTAERQERTVIDAWRQVFTLAGASASVAQAQGAR
jgi:hypothetical protein